MSIELQVFIAGDVEPLSFDDYATYLASVAAGGTDAQQLVLPDELYYDNPREGTFLSITPETNGLG